LVIIGIGINFNFVFFVILEIGIDADPDPDTKTNGWVCDKKEDTPVNPNCVCLSILVGIAIEKWVWKLVLLRMLKNVAAITLVGAIWCNPVVPNFLDMCDTLN